jgi:purine-nucleoside phosphorylase
MPTKVNIATIENNFFIALEASVTMSQRTSLFARQRGGELTFARRGFRFNKRNANVMKPILPQAAAAQLHRLSRSRPTLAVVLGSGFHHALASMAIEHRIPYAKLAGFPPVGVRGHAGELIFGRLGGTPVIALSGRAHFYEGHAMERVTFAIRALAEFGIRDLLLTNAAGGVNRRFRPGHFMVLTDHINFMGVNPLRGATVRGRLRFVDLTQVYDPKLSALLQRAARAAKAKLHRGVYLAVSGPSYETPAEVRAYARLGADAVGMSTVPEAIVARQCDLRVAAMSCITNLAAGISPAPLSHAEVLATAERVKAVGANLLESFVKFYGEALRKGNRPNDA